MHDLLYGFIAKTMEAKRNAEVVGYIKNFKDFVKNDLDFWIVDKAGERVDFDNELFSVVTFGDNYVVMTKGELK